MSVSDTFYLIFSISKVAKNYKFLWKYFIVYDMSFQLFIIVESMLDLDIKEFLLF